MIAFPSEDSFTSTSARPVLMRRQSESSENFLKKPSHGKMFESSGEYWKKRTSHKDSTCTDATIIKAPSSTKNQEKKRDPEMSSTKKVPTINSGMKAHIGTDAKSKLIHTVKTTTAKFMTTLKFLTNFFTEKSTRLRRQSICQQGERKDNGDNRETIGVKKKKQQKGEPSSAQKKNRKTLCSFRGRTPFHTIKCLWKYQKVRYKDSSKYSSNIYSLLSC